MRDDPSATPGPVTPDPQTVAERAAAAMWADDAASRALGMTLDEVRPGYARLSMQVRADMVNGHAICHGGFVFSLADSAFAFACNSYNRSTVAQACDIVFVAPARLGDTLVAEAVERTRFGRNGVYDVRVRRDAGADVPAAIGAPGGAAGGSARTQEVGGEVVAEFRGRSREIAGTLVEEPRS